MTTDKDALVKEINAILYAGGLYSTNLELHNKIICLLNNCKTALLTAPAEAPAAYLKEWVTIGNHERRRVDLTADCETWLANMLPTVTPLYRGTPPRAEAEVRAEGGAVRLVLAIFYKDRGYIDDGGWLQDEAVKCGVLIEVKATERCIGPDEGNCACAEYGDFPMTCYRLNPALTAHPAAPGKET